jgi:hypothetical protein
MKTIELALQPITGFLVSITRNTQNGWYEIEIGLPSTWYYDENDEIGCEVISEIKTENASGKIIKIFPKNEEIVIDDLVAFVQVIIDTNKRIADKEKQFTDRMQEMKGVLEKEAKKFYEELDELKINSIKTLNDNFVKVLRPDAEKKTRKPRTPRVVTGTTDTQTQNVEEVK